MPINAPLSPFSYAPAQAAPTAPAAYFSYLWCLYKHRHFPVAPQGPKEHPMLKYAIIFAIISLIAGALGFTGVAAGSAGIAKILFIVFLVLAVLFVVMAVLGIGAAKKALK